MPASQNPPVMSMPGMPIGIHESVASVEDFYNAGGSFLAGNLPAARASGKLVYLLQDAHTNSSAQFNTSKTLEWLFKKKKGALKYIFLEAGAGDESLGGLRRFSDLGHRRRVALSYLMQGQLQGSEYFNLTTDEDAVLFGVEDMRLYRQSLVVYRAAAGRRDRFYAYLNKTTAAIDKLKKALFNPLLFTFDAKYQEVRQGGLSWTNYYDAMTRQSQSLGISLRDYPRLKALDRLSRFEKRIDFKKANLEQARAWESLDSQKREAFGFVSRQTLENSCAAAKDTGESAFLSYLEENLAGALKQYPNLSGYIQYRKMAHQLLTHSMQKEEKRLRQQILQALCVNADEASLLKADENIDALKKLLRLSLVPDEFGDYQDNYAAFDMRRMSGFINEKLMSLRDYYADAVFLEPGFEAIVKKCEAFYRLTRQRDASFVRTMLGRMDKAGQSQAVLVTGGYHMPN
ncbi:MAG: hypothetical protein WCG06_03145, partial [Candidatus Omnitrophota bacterium]